jgi:hypothetical protein
MRDKWLKAQEELGKLQLEIKTLKEKRAKKTSPADQYEKKGNEKSFS